MGGGCGCLLLLGCIIGGVVLFGGVGSLFGPGEEVASTDVALGQPFSVSYVQQGSQKYEAWLEVDVSYTNGYDLTGPVTLNEDGTDFGQYTVADDGDGPAVQERSSGSRAPWSYSSVGGEGSASGNVKLFPIPARTAGSTITLSGQIDAPPGTTGTVRLIVAKRD